MRPSVDASETSSAKCSGPDRIAGLQAMVAGAEQTIPLPFRCIVRGSPSGEFDKIGRDFGRAAQEGMHGSPVEEFGQIRVGCVARER